MTMNRHAGIISESKKSREKLIDLLDELGVICNVEDGVDPRNNGIITTVKGSDYVADHLMAGGFIIQRHGELGAPYLDEYFGQFADCKECGTDNILPCKYCRECGAKFGNTKEIPKTRSFEICDCYHIECGKGVCYGTKEREPCLCNGNRKECDFYPEYRK